jgi:soluble lytic murein transglycosylase-like protein
VCYDQRTVTVSGSARRVGWPRALGALAVVFLLAPAEAAADIWSYTDANGVVHFTNLGPRKGWKRVYKTGPGKAAAVRGDCQGCDKVPPRDRTTGRYVRFDEHIREASRLYQIPEILIRAVIRCESDFDPSVVSRAGARGLMQLMPSAQRDMRVADIWDPRQNILGGTRLLRVLANRFSGDLVRTIAGYHAGAGAVDKYRGVPPYETTHTYLKMVLKEYYDLRAREARAAALPAEPRASTP